MALDEKVSQVEARSPEVVDSYREKLEAKFMSFWRILRSKIPVLQQKLSCSPTRSATMRRLFRLHSHIQGMKKMLEEKEGIGRKLDFMAQEMNREANTILSKSSDLIISNIAIDLKTEIEKIREQVQNVE